MRIPAFLKKADAARDLLRRVEEGGEAGPEGPQGPEGPAGPPGSDGADGFPTEAQWNDLVSRVEALESAPE